MGHSTVSLTKKGKLTYNEIISEFEKQRSSDREMYGHSENPDSFYRAYKPSRKHLGPIYSPLKKREIIDKIDNYDSICFYSIPDEVFSELFKKEYKLINKKNETIKELKESILKESNKILSELGLNRKTERSKKDIYFTTPCCKSKINVSAFRNYRTLTFCPICDSNFNNNFESIFRDKVLGKKYSNFKNKINDKIEKLTKEVSDLFESLPKEIDESKLSKKQKDQILTYVFADVHF